jgi:hypothetical protein
VKFIVQALIENRIKKSNRLVLIKNRKLAIKDTAAINNKAELMLKLTKRPTLKEVIKTRLLMGIKIIALKISFGKLSG